jgi:hypothetical protein
MRGVHQEWTEEKARMLSMREDATPAMKALYDSAVSRDKYVNNRMDRLQERINCHRVDIDKSYC